MLLSFYNFLILNLKINLFIIIIENLKKKNFQYKKSKQFITIIKHLYKKYLMYKIILSKIKRTMELINRNLNLYQKNLIYFLLMNPKKIFLNLLQDRFMFFFYHSYKATNIIRIKNLYQMLQNFLKRYVDQLIILRFFIYIQ